MNFIEVGSGNGSVFINVDDVSAITRLFGDRSYVRYSIILRSGKEFTFYEERKAGVMHMPRKVFIEKLKKYANFDA